MMLGSVERSLVVRWAISLKETPIPPSCFSQPSAYTWQKWWIFGDKDIQGCQKLPKVVSLVPGLSIDVDFDDVLNS
jgi:hypothetical protein